MENAIAVYFISAIVTAFVWGLETNDFKNALRGLFWPLYVIRFLIKDLFR